MLRVGGAVLTSVSAVLFLVVFLADLLGLHTNPYLDVVFFLRLPAAMSTQRLTTIAQPSFLTIGYLARPYRANTVQGRLTYYW